MHSRDTAQVFAFLFKGSAVATSGDIKARLDGPLVYIIWGSAVRSIE